MATTEYYVGLAGRKKRFCPLIQKLINEYCGERVSLQVTVFGLGLIQQVYDVTSDHTLGEVLRPVRINTCQPYRSPFLFYRWPDGSLATYGQYFCLTTRDRLHRRLLPYEDQD